MHKLWEDITEVEDKNGDCCRCKLETDTAIRQRRNSQSVEEIQKVSFYAVIIPQKDFEEDRDVIILVRGLKQFTR